MGRNYTTFITNLSRAVSRARVYSSVIVFDYKPGTIKEDDELIDELRHRRDVCRIIDIDIDINETLKAGLSEHSSLLQQLQEEIQKLLDHSTAPTEPQEERVRNALEQLLQETKEHQNEIRQFVRQDTVLLQANVQDKEDIQFNLGFCRETIEPWFKQNQHSLKQLPGLIKSTSHVLKNVKQFIIGNRLSTEPQETAT